MKNTGIKIFLAVVFNITLLVAGIYSFFYFWDDENIYVRSESLALAIPVTLEESSVPVKLEEETPNPVEERRATGDLLPDLVPLPPRDLTFGKNEFGAPLLLFSTTYFNQGDGTLELKPDLNTRGIREDIERDVFQIIYNSDGRIRKKVVGNFLWHQEHLHYHFADFIEYDLESLDDPDRKDLEGSRVKSTFCIRDVSKTILPFLGVDEEARYTICGKELQGVSVGWGDTYYYDYPDQALYIKGLPSGRYRLSFNVNPVFKLDELRYDNNISTADFYLNMEEQTIEILSENPEYGPKVEHIYLDDPFGGVSR